jgi:hypothetical protein
MISPAPRGGGEPQHDHLSSHRIASRPLRKRCPVPAVSCVGDFFSAALNVADERFGFARVTHVFKAASAFFSPLGAFGVLVSWSEVHCESCHGYLPLPGVPYDRRRGSWWWRIWWQIRGFRGTGGDQNASDYSNLLI